MFSSILQLYRRGKIQWQKNFAEQYICRRHFEFLRLNDHKLKKPNNLNMTYYSLGLCKELVVFRVCSNSSNYIHNFLSLFWGCSATWLTLSVRVLGKTLQSGFKTVFCLRKIKKLMKVLAAPYNYLNKKI